MRVLLLQNIAYLPDFGANKANRLLLEALSSNNHSCRALVPASGVHSDLKLTDILAGLKVPVKTVGHFLVFELSKVKVHAYLQTSALIASIGKEIEEFKPDWILVSSEDFGHQFLRAAMAVSPSRVIFLARTTQCLPFGPGAFWPNNTGCDLIKRVRAIVAVSNFVAMYIREHLEKDASAVPLPNFGPGPFPFYGSFDRGYVLMINPCAIKGISIFLQIARSLPDISFAAVASWGTTEADRIALEAEPNIKLLKYNKDIDQIYRETKILLVPSLWDEAYGKVVIEAMLRGIPVIASNVGGLPEAKLGVKYVVPVDPIRAYMPDFDMRRLPLPKIPPQEIKPWLDAIVALTTDADLYESISQDSCRAASNHVKQSGVQNFELFLKSLAGA